MTKQEVVYALVSAVTRLPDHRTVTISRGDTFAAGDEIVAARPGLFSPDPPARTSSALAARATRRCWSCGTRYSPTRSGQRYCGAACRRSRELLLRKWLRRAVGGPARDPKRPPGGASSAEWAGWVARLAEDVGDLEALSAWLSGRPDPADPGIRRVDEARMPLHKSAGLAALVACEVGRLSRLRDEGQRGQADAELREATERGAVVTAVGWADMTGRRDSDRRRWAEELGDE